MTIRNAMGALAFGFAATLNLAAGTSGAEIYRYDAAGRLSSVSYDDGRSVVYTYDSRSNVIAVQPLTADLAVTRGADPDPLELGAPITYSLTFSNQGPDDLGSVTATIDLPAAASLNSVTPGAGICSGSGPISCDLGPLTNGSSVSVSVSLQALSLGAHSGGASVVGDLPDLFAGNDTIALSNTVIDGDRDSDGVSSATELAGPNGGDGNGDGIADFDQPSVASLPTAVTGNYITLSVGGACATIQGATSPLEADLANDALYDFPLGLVGFELPCASASLQLYYHGTSTLSGFSYRKFGASTPGSPATTEWYALSGVTFESQLVGGQTVATASFVLIDGQMGDDTGVDGRIVDPGGPGRLQSMREISWDPDDMSIPTSDDASTVYIMPFAFPFNGRNIVKLAINTNGLIELLEGGESCAECSAFSTHASGSHVTKNIDAIFAFNDDLKSAVVVNGGADGVVIEWLGTTRSDLDFESFPLLFSVSLFPDGRVVWKLAEVQWSSHSGDLFTGLYDEVADTEIEIPGGSVNAASLSTFEWDPSGPSLLGVPWSNDGALATGDDVSVNFPLPFSFPWGVRAIQSVDVNSNGLLELLEAGESCLICGDYATHFSGDHIGAVDSIFALNDDLRSGVQIRAGADRVTMTWFGTTWSDGDFGVNPLVHQTILYDDGRIEWKFHHVSWSSFSGDLFSGTYDAGTNVEDEIAAPSTSIIGTAVNRRFLYDPNPVPEPSALAGQLSVIALLAALRSARRRKLACPKRR